MWLHLNNMSWKADFSRPGVITLYYVLYCKCNDNVAPFRCVVCVIRAGVIQSVGLSF